jgi:hypothetical protein
LLPFRKKTNKSGKRLFRKTEIYLSISPHFGALVSKRIFFLFLLKIYAHRDPALVEARENALLGALALRIYAKLTPDAKESCLHQRARFARVIFNLFFSFISVITIYKEIAPIYVFVFVYATPLQGLRL